MKQHKAFIIAGEEAVRAYDDTRHDAAHVKHLQSLGNVFAVSFDTEAELIAYIDGFEAAIGWLDHAVLPADDPICAHIQECGA